MKTKLTVQKFIEENPDWEERLAGAPWFVKVSRDEFDGRKLVMLKYGIESDFREEICRECRGLVLDESDWSVVSYPFRKFGNYGEGPWVDEIDWSTAKAQEKIDGSLIKVVKTRNGLLVSTNGTILAEKAPVADQPGCPYGNFADVFYHGVGQAMAELCGGGEALLPGEFPRGFKPDAWLYGILNEGLTYMFELVSPWTKVVVPYPRTEVFMIGIRDNETGEEIDPSVREESAYFNRPRLFPLTSLDECLESARALPWNEEGYVVVDGMFRRNKIKSPAYLACHHMRGEGPMTYRRAIDLIRTGEVDEVLAYFPEFEKPIRETEELTAAYSRRLQGGLDFLNERLAGENATRETARTDKALRGRLARDIVKNLKDTGFAFAWLDGKVEKPEDWIAAMPSTKLADIIAKQTA